MPDQRITRVEIIDPKPFKARTALESLRPFMGNRQRRYVAELMRGEEKDFFIEKMIELAGIVDAMPRTYEQDGKGEDAMVYLHYFAGGSANWWITEKDSDPADENGHREGQVQAFGLANFFGGPNDQDAELGYISIVEILANGGELDFYFKPRTLRELKNPSEIPSYIDRAPHTGLSSTQINSALRTPRSALDKAQSFFANL